MSQMNKKLYSFSSLGFIAIAFIALVVIVNIVFRGAQLDLTEDRLFTLSEGSKNILRDIDEPVNLYLFLSEQLIREIGDEGVAIRRYSERVREMLEEFSQLAGSKIQLEVIDPLSFSEEEDLAASYGIQGIPVGSVGDNLFFGLAATNSIDSQEVIPFFDPTKERFLEYDLIRLIYSLDHPERPVMGLMSELAMTRGFDPSTRQMRQPWIIAEQLEQLYDLKEIPSSVTEIDSDVDILLVVHPKGLSDATLFAIDQFVLRGGKLLAFMDPVAEVDQPQDVQNPQAAMFADRSSTLGVLLDAWGVEFSTSEVVLDRTYAYRVPGGRGQRAVEHPGILTLDQQAMAADDVTLANLNSLNLSLAGHFKHREGAQSGFVPLISTSTTSMTVAAERVKFLPDPSALLNGFTSSDEKYVLAARVQGVVNSAFPDGFSLETEAAGTVPTVPLKSTDNANIIVVADVDMLTDRLWVQVQQIFGQRLANAFANNGDFVVNSVQNFSGNEDLIKVRGGASALRPFTRVEALAQQASDRYRETEQQLNQELQETERKLSELQAGRNDGNPLILSAEQQQELDRFQQEKLRVRKELRSVRSNLRKDIEGLGYWIKAINIALVPLLLTIFALFKAWSRSQLRKGV